MACEKDLRHACVIYQVSVNHHRALYGALLACIPEPLGLAVLCPHLVLERAGRCSGVCVRQRVSYEYPPESLLTIIILFAGLFWHAYLSSSTNCCWSTSPLVSLRKILALLSARE